MGFRGSARTVPQTITVCADFSSYILCWVKVILGPLLSIKMGEEMVWRGLEWLLSLELQHLPEGAELGAAQRHCRGPWIQLLGARGSRSVDISLFSFLG